MNDVLSKTLPDKTEGVSLNVIKNIETKTFSKEEEIEGIINDSFLKTFLYEENITDIGFDGTTLRVQHNVKGRYKTDYQPTSKQVHELGSRIADVMGKEFTTNDPILDTELSFLRVNFIHHSVSPSGTTLAIRISKPHLAIENLKDISNEDVAQLLDILMKAEMNTIISGRTGSGKTELQKMLVGFIPDNKKITLIEDTMDSHIKALYPNKDINSWRTLTDSLRENKITYSDLIKAGLRNNPDWIIVAETRGSESLDMLQSALTDHNVITTIHARGATGIPTRIIFMIGGNSPMDEIVLGKEIVNTLSFGVYMTLEETESGIKRFIQEIIEYVDYTKEGLEYIPLYRVHRNYDETQKKYIESIEMNPLSKRTINELMKKRLFHLIPKVFLEGGEQNNE